MPSEQTVDALKLAYRKLSLNDDAIGSGELADALCNAICEEVGDDEWQRWLDEWQDEDRTYTNTERVMDTRIDATAERREAALPNGRDVQSCFVNFGGDDAE